MIDSIRLLESQKQDLITHAEKCIPNESCAILYGKVQDGHAIVIDMFLTHNIDNSPKMFSIKDKDIIKAYNEAEKRNVAIVSIFHSHPTTHAKPSATDLKYMEINPVVWIIYSGTAKEFKAFVLDDKSKEKEIRITNR